MKICFRHGRWIHCLLFALLAAALCCVDRVGLAQESAGERSFPQSKATVEQILKGMKDATAGRLPVLEGFALPAERSLDRYQRGYYQSKIQVSAAPSGGSIVRVSVEVTAWYNDPAGHSGYRVLTSNGRLEADLLDRLSDQLAAKPAQNAPRPVRTPEPSQPAMVATNRPASESTNVGGSAPVAPSSSAKPEEASEPNISAPSPRLPDSSNGISSGLTESLAEQEKNAGKTVKKLADDDAELQAEASSLEEILRNQAHPGNLVAVKKSGTPVVDSASLNAKTLFLASAHDEFEMLDFNRDWVHVRVSGLSRGWIWRNNLEMPSSVPDADIADATAAPAAADLFHVTREEQALFPGDWAPLRSKMVEIVSVEKINESEKDTGPQLRLEFAKSVLDKDYAELAKKPQELAGIVLIFDSADGGMIAATSSMLQQWKAGQLSDAGLWHQCFFDPPESFTASAAAASK